MTKISAFKFKEQCLSFLDEVGPEGILITKRGKPITRLMPVDTEHRPLIGCLMGKLQIKGDVLSTGLRWMD